MHNDQLQSTANVLDTKTTLQEKTAFCSFKRVKDWSTRLRERERVNEQEVQESNCVHLSLSLSFYSKNNFSEKWQNVDGSSQLSI